MRKLTTTMKALMLVAAFIWPALSAMAQPWTENFDSQTSNSYISPAATLTINGLDWEFSDAGNFSYANTNMGSYAATINDDKTEAYIRTPELNTCGTVSFQYAFINGSETNVFVLQKSTDGTTWTDLDTHTLGAAANLAYQPYTFDVNDAAASLYIRILSDDQNAHLFIENFEVTAFSSTPDPEPTNHVTDFAAAEDDASSITLTWTDNDGAQAADAFLVKASTGAITDPVDGTEEADAALIANVASGEGTVTFTGLTAATLYNFAIYPYTNSGADIDYLVAGAPTASATTMAGGTLSWYNLQWPHDSTTTVGAEYVVYAQAYEDGLTNAAGQAPGLEAWIGYSMDNTDPSTWTNWVDATYFGESGNNDEFTADLSTEFNCIWNVLLCKSFPCKWWRLYVRWYYWPMGWNS
jgi:hypothetical protein